MRTERHDWYKKVFESFKSKRITILQGLRRTGKTTILKSIKNDLKDANYEIIEYNFNTFLSNDSIELKKMREYFSKEPDKKFLLLLDEFQEYEEWNRFFTTVYNENMNVKIIATGSVSHNTTKTNNTEGGRYNIITLPTLSFQEFLKLHKKLDIEEKKLDNFFDYATKGSYPIQGWTSTLTEYKKQISENIIEKIRDSKILSRFNITKSANIDSILRYVIENIGSTISPTSISQKINISKETVDKIIEYLKDNHIIYQINNITSSIGKASKLNKKYYLNDHTFYLFIHSLSFKELFKNPEDHRSSFIFENIVINEIRRRYNSHEAMIYFLLNKEADLDMVINKNEINYHFEIKATSRKDCLTRDQTNFIKECKLNVIYFGEDSINKNKNYINIFTFLKGEEKWI